MLHQVTYSKIGQQRGHKRLWLEGARLEAAGFAPGASYRLVIDDVARSIKLLREDGSRVVSRKVVRERVLPVIDICNGEILKLFGSAATRVKVEISTGCVVVTIHPLDAAQHDRVQRLKTKLESGLPLEVGSIAHGGGVLDNALHAGFARSGINTHLAWAIEIEGDYLAASMANNEVFCADTVAIHGAMEEVDFAALGSVDCIHAGIPCTGASVAGRSKNKLKAAEHHETAGVLFYSLLAIIKAVNPAIIIFENVVPFSSTLSMYTIRQMLVQWGYALHERTLDGNSMGALEDRKRMCMVAVPAGIAFDFDALVAVREKEPRLADVLEDIPADSPLFQNYQYLADKEVRDIAAGKGFRRQLLTPEATACGCIGAGYQKIRSTEPMVAHPSDSSKSRLLTPLEHARVKTIPPHLVAGVPKTTANEILGQSVIWLAFVSVGILVAQSLARWLAVPVDLAEPVCADEPIQSALF